MGDFSQRWTWVRFICCMTVGTVFIASASGLHHAGPMHPTWNHPRGGRDEYGPYSCVLSIFIFRSIIMIPCRQSKLFIVKFVIPSVIISLSLETEISKKGSSTAMANIFHLLANEDKLTDELFAFVTDSSADS